MQYPHFYTITKERLILKQRLSRDWKFLIFGDLSQDSFSVFLDKSVKTWPGTLRMAEVRMESSVYVLLHVFFQARSKFLLVCNSKRNAFMMRAARDTGKDKGKVGSLPDFFRPSLDAMRWCNALLVKNVFFYAIILSLCSGFQFEPPILTSAHYNRGNNKVLTLLDKETRLAELISCTTIIAHTLHKCFWCAQSQKSRSLV